MPSHRCSKCKETKPVAEFGASTKTPTGLYGRCRKCVSLDNARKYRADTPGRKAAAQKWAEENRARRRTHSRTCRTRRMLDPAARRKAYEASQKWAKANPTKRAALEAAKKARRKGRAVHWDPELDALTREEAYHLAAMRAELTGTPWHVDHIVPMLCKTACGLDNAFNLAVVPASFNLAKGNRLTPHQVGFVVEIHP